MAPLPLLPLLALPPPPVLHRLAVLLLPLLLPMSMAPHRPWLPRPQEVEEGACCSGATALSGRSTADGY
jgi:hypothetical protein